nr:hypothetical protein [Paenibacillus bovis]
MKLYHYLLSNFHRRQSRKYRIDGVFQSPKFIYHRKRLKYHRSKLVK